MAITGFNESTLATSEIWEGINASNPNKNPRLMAMDLAKTAKILTNEDIEAAYISVKQISDTLTMASLKAFDNGRVILLYNSIPQKSVTQSLPFITFKMKNGEYKTYVFMDKYITMTRDNVLNLQAPVLRDLLIGATIANGLKRNYNTMASNEYLQRTLSDIYTKFVTRVLNREFSIATDKVGFDKIQYFINKFFLLRIMGANNSPENIESISSAHFKYIDELDANEVKQIYNNANPAKISELLTLLRENYPRMKQLNLMTFLSDWINYYYVPSMLAVDNIEYLIFMIMTLLGGNNIISIAASDIVKETKNIKSLRVELLKLV